MKVLKVCVVLFTAAVSMGTTCGGGDIGFNGTGADWDGKSTEASQVVIVAAYESTPSLRSQVIDIDTDMDADRAGRRHKDRWNKWKHRANVGLCPGDDSKLRFSNHVQKVVVIDIHGVSHDLLPGTEIEVADGLKLKGTDGTCD